MRMEVAMGHHIQWDNEEKTVVLQQYLAGAVKDDLYLQVQKSAEMLKSVPHTVHLIIDETKVKLILNSADLKYLEKLVPPNQGAVVVVVNKSNVTYKRVVQDMGNKLAPKAFDNVYNVSSIEEARQLLRDQFGVNYP